MDNIKKFAFIILLIFNSLNIYCQSNNLCNLADPFCTGTTYNFPAGVNAGQAQTGPNYGCLYSQPNPAWYYMQVANSGNITIYMYSQPSYDIDFALWGPFTSPTAPCTAQLTATCTGCQSNTYSPPGYYPQGNLVDCSYSGSAFETAHIPNATAGEYYLLLITNYSNQPCNILFSQTAGPGTTNCGIMAPPITDNGPLCVGDTLIFNVTQPYPGGTYFWTGPNGFTSTQMNPVIYNVTTAAAGIYSMTVTAGSQTSPAVTDTVVINPLPLPTASNNSPLCLASTINLSATGGTSYLWSGPNSFTSTSQTPSITNITSANAGTYNVTVTDVNTCTASSSTSVIINLSPTISASNNSPICNGTTLNISATGGTSYLWSGPNSFTSTVQSPIINNAILTNAGLYSVTVTDVNGCTGITTTNVLINSLPPATAISNSPICDGSTLLLTGGGGAGYLWTGPNGFTSTEQYPIITGAGVIASGTYTVLVTSSNGCILSTSTQVTVNPSPTPIAGSNSPICSGDTLFLTTGGVSGVNSYVWSGPNGYSATDQNPFLAQATNVYSGLYTVAVRDVNGCLAISPTNVIVNTITPSIGNNTPICSGNTISIFASGGVTYNWSGPNGYTSAQSVLTIPQATTNDMGLYSVTITDVNGCVGSLYTYAIVNPLPVPVATNNSPICFGEDIKLICGGGTSYAWSGPINFISTEQNPVIYSAGISASGQYNVIATDLNGCSSATSTTVIVNPLPVVTVSNNTPICSGGTVNITGSGGTGYAWSCGENGYTSISQNPTIVGSTPLSSGHYTVTVTLNGCTSTGTTTVVVNPLPIPSATSNSPICYGDMLELTATGGTTYVWNSSNGFTSNLALPVINNATDALSGIYVVTVTDVNGCSAIATTTVSVASRITVQTIDMTICSGTTVTISAYVIGGTAPYSYYWDGFLSQSQVIVTPITDISYEAQVLDANGCRSNISTLHIDVLPPVEVNAFINNNSDTICPGESVVINVTPSNGDGGPYSLYLSDGTIITSPYTAYPDGVHEFIIMAQDGCGSIDSDTIRIRVYEIPPMSYSPDNTFGCAPLEVFFNETSEDIGQTYLWDFGDDSYNSNSYTQNPSHIYENAGVYDVRLTITSAEGCKTIYTYTNLITSYQSPEAAFYPDYNLVNIINPIINFENASSNGTHYYWTFGDGDSSDLFNTSHYYESIGTFNVQLVVESVYGCRDTAIETIYVQDEYTLFAPTAFTPDNDGTNDIFYLQGNGIDTNSFNMIIYDRWGEKIYETTNYSIDDPKKYGWDGTVKGTNKIAEFGILSLIHI